MPASYQTLLIDSLLIVSLIELVLCFALSAYGKRSTDPEGPPAAPEPEMLDPFSIWINMLERQKDRRGGARYGGAERRTKIAYSNLASK